MSDATGIQNGQTAGEANFTGIIWPYAGSGTPGGFLACDGNAVSRSTYSRLFGVIGTTYGVGDGSTTFNVPDLRGRTIVGVGSGTKVGTFSSRSSNTITVTGLTNAANNEFQTGQAVTYHTSGSVITGLSNNTVYYVIRISNTSFQLAASLSDAQNGTAISLSSDGSGTQTFTLSLSTRSSGDTGGEEIHSMSAAELLSHRHRVAQSASGSLGSTIITTTTDASGDASYTYTDGTVHGADAILEHAGGNSAMNAMQPFVALKYIIKT